MMSKSLRACDAHRLISNEKGRCAKSRDFISTYPSNLKTTYETNSRIRRRQ